MFVVGEDRRVARWVYEQIGGPLDTPECTAVGWAREGELSGGLVYHSYTPQRNIFEDIALTGRHVPRAFLRFGLAYPFHQLRVPRLTFSIDSANLSSVRLVAQLGAIREATLSCAARQGDLEFWVLRLDASPLCRRILDGKVKHARGPGLR
jgi:RimJ/RimL family protein N-acetyltransferase